MLWCYVYRIPCWFCDTENEFKGVLYIVEPLVFKTAVLVFCMNLGFIPLKLLLVCFICTIEELYTG